LTIQRDLCVNCDRPIPFLLPATPIPVSDIYIHPSPDRCQTPISSKTLYRIYLSSSTCPRYSQKSLQHNSCTIYSRSAFFIFSSLPTLHSESSNLRYLPVQRSRKICQRRSFEIYQTLSSRLAPPSITANKANLNMLQLAGCKPASAKALWAHTPTGSQLWTPSICLQVWLLLHRAPTARALYSWFHGS